MKKVLKYGIIILLIVLLLLAIWFIFKPEKQELEQYLENVVMTIKDGTLTNKGATIIITDPSGDIHTYGDFFRIDEFKDNEWVPLKPIIDDYGFNAIGYHVDENNKLEMNIDWEWLYGELKSGKYRLVKDVAINVEDQYLGSEYIYVEFSI